ncbi:lysine 2,3-aminomutase [Leptospira kobayashii]|uniref:Lysine 2,3-aminomutase n=1 Tax=Leptospira kobayashii TaxID=1917830 RepID=A0ABM7UP21_9LEPT|nr:KamA family radical SAM protein [Leptospira kobayashii]BDA80927.1 lysine 2,3-aminomutase [Leptospira kobayashii]
MSQEDWMWQMQNRITDLATLKNHITLSEEEESVFQAAQEQFSFSITPYYLSLLHPTDAACPIRKQVLPRSNELIRAENEWEDPLAEQVHMPIKGVTHRYPDRAIWYISHVCAVYCRFCTRKRKVSKPTETPNREEWQEALEYFRNHTEIKEVILSGGDPLTLSDQHIDYLLSELSTINHINHLRVHTRYPVTMPMRITDSLCEIFSKYFPLYIVTHFNHPKELTQEVKVAIEKLIRKGNVTVLNQSVLLKGVNDTVETLEELNYKLVRFGIKPYYLHQCDEVYGSSGFVVPIEEGIRLMYAIRGRMSGLTVPNYVKDLTGGGGKVLLGPNYLIEKKETSYLFKNFNGGEYEVTH